MNSTGARVLVVVPAKSSLESFLVEDLRAAGHDVEVQHGGHEAFEAAKARPPAAILTGEGFGSGWLRLATRIPALASVPLVAVTGEGVGKPRFSPFAWPIRWTCTVRASEAHLRGVPSAAVRDAIAAGGPPPATRRERLAARMCQVGSLIYLASALALIGGAVATARGSSWRTAWIFSAVAGQAVGMISGDLGTRLARGYPPGLAASTWAFVGLALVAAIALAGRLVG